MAAIYPATQSNQISKSYYHTLVGQINNGTCTKRVQRVVKKYGDRHYETYHLISVR